MKKTGLISFVVLVAMAGQAIGNGGWCDVEIAPGHPASFDVVVITLSGWWSDSCIPNASNVSVFGNNIYFDVIWDYPPDVNCDNVITPWTLTEYVGPLSAGAYTVYAHIVGYPGVPEYEPVAEFIVMDKQFVVSTEALAVPEGGTKTFTVALLLEPAGTVEVSVIRQSGDPDITVESGGTLFFDPCDYSVPQTVTVAAAEDDDYLNGVALIQVTAPDYLTAEVTATEADNDIPLVLYIDADATGNNNGRSWADAFNYLQDALDVAQPGDQIWVAAGTYYPDDDKDGDHTKADPAETFQLLDGVEVYGGFAVGETSLDERDWRNNETILSGDLKDYDIVLLLHLDGSDEATSTTDSSAGGHTPISFGGTAQLDTAEKKWGSASLLLDGDGDYLTIPDSDDWDICGSSMDDWTIDFWVKMTDHTGTEVFITQCEGSVSSGGGNRWALLHTATEGLRFLMMSNDVLAVNAAATPEGEISDSDWHHIALCKVGPSYAIYKDGLQVNYTNDSSTDTFAAALTIGRAVYRTKLDLAGHMDEIRITHDNRFGASANADKTDIITVPTSEHSAGYTSGAKSYHVVTGSGADETAVLDGFTITGGNANGGGQEDFGGGMYNDFGSPTVTNCKFSSNRAEQGGGLANTDASSPTLINCTFISNASSSDAGGIYNYLSSPRLVNCVFSGCTARRYGGGVANFGGSNPAMVNCILWGNSDEGGTDESAQIHGSMTTVDYSCIQGWTGSLGGAGNIGADPCFADPCSGDYHLKSQAGRWDSNTQSWFQDDVTSPCIDRGNPSSSIGWEPYPNGGRINMGAYGGTEEASKSYFGAPVCQKPIAGDINGDCKVDFIDFVIMACHWLEDNRE